MKLFSSTSEWYYDDPLVARDWRLKVLLEVILNMPHLVCTVDLLLLSLSSCHLPVVSFKMPPSNKINKQTSKTGLTNMAIPIPMFCNHITVISLKATFHLPLSMNKSGP